MSLYLVLACVFADPCRILYLVIFFFFKQKTAYEMRISDWSSDVCSSDLRQGRCGDAVLDDQRDRRVRHALIGQRSALFLGAAGGNRIRHQDYLLVSDTQLILKLQ